MTGAAHEPASSWDGFEYEKVSALQRRVGGAFIDSLDLARAQRILDVGCGDGYLTEQIARRSRADVLGVDSSAAMLARAAERTSARLRFAEVDASSMEFSTSFDLIVSLNTLHWIVDLGTAFRRMLAAQGVGGELVCQFVGASETESVEDVATGVIHEGSWREFFGDGFHPYTHPTKRELREVAEAAGYRVEECATWGEVFPFPSAAHFAHWCAAGMTVWTDRLPSDRREAFVHEVTTRYARTTGSDREFRFAQVRLLAASPEAGAGTA